MSVAAKKPAARQSASERLASFIAKFDPPTAKLIRACRAELRERLPTADEIVYDNYNFFVIGYSASGRPSDCIVSLAAAANGVGLSFYHGASLPDPQRLLQGNGKQNRFIRLPDVDTLRSPGVRTLIDEAIARARARLRAHGRGALVIKSVSATQRPRRRNAPAT